MHPIGILGAFASMIGGVLVLLGIATWLNYLPQLYGYTPTVFIVWGLVAFVIGIGLSLTGRAAEG